MKSMVTAMLIVGSWCASPKSASAQTWTQVNVPNVGTCYYPGPPIITTNGCVMGSTSQPSSQPNPTSQSTPASINNPGLGTNSGTPGQFRTGCTYPNGTPQQYGGGNIWAPASIAGQPVVSSSSYWLISNYIQWYDSFYGLEFFGRFTGSTSPSGSGDGAIFYSDNECFSGGREYGVRYDYSSGSLQLYWSANTNCDSIVCYSDSARTTRVHEQSNACVITGINPAQDHVYQVWFSSNNGQATVNCALKDSNLNPITTNKFDSKPGWSFNFSTGVYSGPLDSWFARPTTLSVSGAGWLTAAFDNRVLNPSGSGTLYVNWIKAAK